MNRDQGLVTAFVTGLVMTFVVAAGLAVDGGRLVAAHVTAGDHAENAARAGAQEVTLVRLGWRLIDPSRATA
ncbi:MAG: pilus assembly protein TadG-related protein, partial [Ilumatobacteraceae bacterium]